MNGCDYLSLKLSSRDDLVRALQAFGLVRRVKFRGFESHLFHAIDARWALRRRALVYVAKRLRQG